jgi:EAL domain-containing protein (putative c-di-GMP-specific phosphodiesterase class I)
VIPPPIGANSSQAHGGHILLVDDEEAMIRLLARVLRATGYEVTTASDGQTAVRLLESSTFDLVLSDIDMPRMDGIRLLQAVRQGDFDVPVILMTGAPTLKTAVEAVSLGALLYLTKPIDVDELKAAVSRAVRLKKVAGLKDAALALVNHGGLGRADLSTLRTSFDRALNGMWLAYQPIVRVGDRSLFAYEALLRSSEPALPHPGALLDAAERLGRVEAIGQRVRAAVAVQITDAASTAAIFVNLHARDLLDEKLFSPTSPLSSVANRIVLEITERASLDIIPNPRARVAELRGLGFRIAIDDLGAGYSGLTSFATLEPDFVKLDMSLVRGVDHDPMKEKLVRAMTALCKDLGMTVVAEGVETIAERDKLVELGCDLLQGYLLGRPERAFRASAWGAAALPTSV